MDFRKLKAAAIGGAAIVLAVAFGAGQFDDEDAVGSYRGGYYRTAGASFAGGSAIAGWDTIPVVFHSQALVAVPVYIEGVQGIATNPAGIDTFAYPASSTAADQARIHNLNDIVLGRAEASWRDDDGDAAQMVRLGTGFACPTFAWTTIDEGDQDGFYGSQFWYMRSNTTQSINAGTGNVTYLRQTIGNSASNRQAQLYYIPFENHIPAGSTIVSASLNFANLGGMYYAYGDTIINVLMDRASDDEWYKVKGGTGLNALSANYAKASWLYQTDTNASGTVWGGAQANAWSPTLAVRKYYWQMGFWNDWSSTSITPGGFVPAGANVASDITDCVQAAVAGLAANNGIMQLWQGTAITQLLSYGWDNYSSAIGRNPFVVVKYITKKFRPLYGTSDIAFAFTTDDFIEGANSAFTDTFNAHGAVYTMFGARKHVDGTVKQSGMDSLLTWLNEGHEIGTHSRTHQNPAGLTYWEQSRPGKVWDATARAQTWFDAEPIWLYALADSATGDSLKTHPQFAKSMALPNNTISAGVQRVLADQGYLSIRGMGVQGFDRTKYYWFPSWAPAYADSGVNPTQTAQRRPRNMALLMYTTQPLQFVGLPTRTSADLDSVRHNVRRMLFQIRGQSRGEFAILTHDVKATHPVASGFGYADGMNPDEVGAMLDVADEIGVRYMTASDIGRWRRDAAKPIDTPAGFYSASVQDDSARYYAAERVWFKPDGIDGRWIPGVR
jgi:hypothetical protein